MTACKKCHTPMEAGVAIQQTYTGIPDFAGDAQPVTISIGDKGNLVECLKCPVCGWSVTK